MVSFLNMETDMFENARFIIHPQNKLYEPVCFVKEISLTKKVKKAFLHITALGCYYAELNGSRVGNFILAPGFTSYKRVQYQSYDVTKMLCEENTLEITISEGWYKGKINFNTDKDGPEKKKALIAELEIIYADGTTTKIATDSTWLAKKDKIRFAELYDGESVDMTYSDKGMYATELEHDKSIIVKQQGELVCEQEIIEPLAIFTAPNGQTLVDFGQNLTGYFEIELEASCGDKVSLSVCEELDKNGNFYNENYRDAKARFDYICKQGHNKYKPRLAFWGFRYIRIEAFPTKVTKENIHAIVVHSDIKRTGYLHSSSKLLNQLFSNIIWGQKGNFLDIPTDCPQRDERQGWTGDATVFCKAASYNFDVEKFFLKWLTDLRLDQGVRGNIPNIIPQTNCWDWSTTENTGAVWGDSATIIPYQMYMTYGNKEFLSKQYGSMLKYLRYIANSTTTRYLWTGCEQFGDWLALDASEGSYRGASSDDFIASVFYANSVKIVAHVAKILGKNAEKHEKLYAKIISKIRSTFTEYKTQTECVLALYFDIATDKKAVAKGLADMIIENGKRLKTGFVGTPFLLHALSQNGYSDLAYDLLLQEQFPSWLYSVRQGATTIWEHWDGKNERGEFWSSRMNSFNHYAYGSVADWVYEVGCGIKPLAPGFERVLIAPVATSKLEHLSATLETKKGTIKSSWYTKDGKTRYEITTPTDAKIIIEGKEYNVSRGSYIF